LATVVLERSGIVMVWTVPPQVPDGYDDLLKKRAAFRWAQQLVILTATAGLLAFAFYSRH
jgi:hypothetical protein